MARTKRKSEREIRTAFGFKKDEPIPQKFFIRKSVIGNAKHPVLCYTYWNYRENILGSVQMKMPRKIKGEPIDQRRKVLDIIRQKYPEAEAFRIV